MLLVLRKIVYEAEIVMVTLLARLFPLTKPPPPLLAALIIIIRRRNSFFRFQGEKKTYFECNLKQRQKLLAVLNLAPILEIFDFEQRSFIDELCLTVILNIARKMYFYPQFHLFVRCAAAWPIEN